MKFGLMIVVVALMGSIIAGSIAVETGTHEETAYNHLTDLGPIVTYENVDTSIQYNPIRNVTGWTGVTYQTQSNPSIYAMQTGQTSSTITSSTLQDMGGVYYADDAAYGYDGGFAYGGEYPYIVWSDMATGTNPTEDQLPNMGWNPRYNTNGQSLMIGGYSQTWEQDGYNVESVVTVGVRQGETGLITWPTSSGNPYYWQNLARVAAAQGWPTGTVVTSYFENSGNGPEGIALYKSTTFDGSYLNRITTDSGLGTSEVTWRTSATLILNCYFIAEGTEFWWDRNTSTFHEITGTDANGLPQFAAASTDIEWVSHSLTDTLELTRWTTSNTTYVTPNTDVTLDGETASWSNGYNNDSVQFLVSPEAKIMPNSTYGGLYLPSEALNYEMVMVTLDSDFSESYWQGVISYNGPSDYSLLSYKRPLYEELSTGGYSLTLTPSSSWENDYTSGYPVGSEIYVSLNGFSGGTFSISGANATLYTNSATITDLQETVYINYTIPPSGSSIVPVIYSYIITPISDGQISSMQISKPLSSTDTIKMAIVNTWVPADPNGLLWQNPSMDLAYYFSDLISTSGIRVTFGSTLSTGTSMTICGNTFETGDGKILINGSLYPINGLSVDITEGRAEIFSGESSVISYYADSYTISGAGVWMWSAALYEPYTTVVEDVDVEFGQGSSRNWMIFAFLGICVTGVVVFAAWGRGSMDIWDWVVLGAAVLIGFVVI